MSLGEVASGAGMGLNILGGLVKAGGQKLSGEVAAAGENYKALQADYAAEIQDYQAQVALNNAQTAINTGARIVAGAEQNVTTEGYKTAAMVGKIKANQAASNVDVNTGSAVQVRADAASAGMTNQENILSAAQLQNWGYGVTASNFQTQANLDKSQGQILRQNAQFYRSMAPYAIEGGNIAAAGTLIDSASSVPFRWGGDGASVDPAASSAYGSPRPAYPSDALSGGWIPGGI